MNRKSPKSAQTKMIAPSGFTCKLTIAYDGTNYAGWQLQPNGVSVQELLEKALEKISGQKTRVHGSGRTDAGVHAKGQVAHFTLADCREPLMLKRALNANLPEDIRVLNCAQAPSDFHARYSVKGKEYRYHIDCSEVADPFSRRYALHHPKLLNVTAMRKAAKILTGRHNFLALSANPMRVIENPVRTISRLVITKHGNVITISVRANGFLYKMVRSIAGALLKIGEGKISVMQLREILQSEKRTALVETAPAKGLFLWKVFY